MKTIALFFSFFFILNFISAQEYKSFEVNNVAEEEVWPAVYKTMQALKLPKAVVNKNTGIGETGYYNYTAIMIKNRCRFRFEYAGGMLTVSIFGRQYLSEKGWADNVLPMTKKQASKLLDPIEKRLSTLSNNGVSSNDQAVAVATTNTPKQPSTSNTKKPGIYDDFVVVKTDDPDMDLLAIHENGDIMGFDLWEDKKTVKTLVFKEGNDAEPIIMQFKKNGSPDYLVTDHCLVHINPTEENKFELTVTDVKGEIVGTNNIEIPKFDQTYIEIQQGQNNHGPANPNISYINIDDYLSMYIGASSTITKAVSCGAGIAGGLAAEAATAGAATPLVVVGVIAACESIYFDLVAKYVGKDHFLYDELNLASDISSIISAINPLDSKKWVTILSVSNDAIPSFKNAIEAGLRLKEEILRTPQITISGYKEVRTGAFGEFGRAYEVYASSNYPEEITWTNNSYELEIQKIELGDENYVHADNERRYFGIEVKAKELLDRTSYPVLQAIQMVNGKKFTKEIKLELVKPTYYYVSDCSNCDDDPVHQTECKEKLKQCVSSIKENIDAIYFVIDSEDNIIESNKELTKDRLAFIRTETASNHGFIPLVIKSNCSFNCEGLTDKETIITLAHEAMNKIKINESKITKLQKTAELNIRENQDANNPQLLKIASDINDLEEASEKIRNEYGDKINKIAEKGTIHYPFTQTDHSKCYAAEGVYVSGAHWSNSWLTILLRYEISPKQCREELEYGAVFEGEGIGQVTCIYRGKDNKEISRGAIINFSGKFQAGINFPVFEKTETIDFFKSEPTGVWKESK